MISAKVAALLQDLLELDVLLVQAELLRDGLLYIECCILQK